MTTPLDRAREAWLREHDDAAGSAYGELLEAGGDTGGARAIYEELIRSGYLVGHHALAWLEHASGDGEQARDLLRNYLDVDDEPDEQTELVSGVLGQWTWHESHDSDAEALLVRGPDACPSARADPAHLYRATERATDAEGLLKIGVDRGEVESFAWQSSRRDRANRRGEGSLHPRFRTR